MLHRVEDLEGKVVAARGEFADGGADQVISDYRGNGSGQSGGGGDQSLRNTRRNRAKSRRACGA